MRSDHTLVIESGAVCLAFGGSAANWHYAIKGLGVSLPVSLPTFIINGKQAVPDGTALGRSGHPVAIGTTVLEHRLHTTSWQTAEGSAALGASFTMVIRTTEENPIVRFRFELGSPGRAEQGTVVNDAAAAPARLMQSEDGVPHAPDGPAARTRYLAVPYRLTGEFVETTLSEFDELVHTYRPVERRVSPVEIDHGESRMGPLLTAKVGGDASEAAGASAEAGHLLIAYEHGSQTPDAFLEYRFDRDCCALEAVKANFANGLLLDRPAAFESVWFCLAICRGGPDEPSARFRNYMLHHVCPNRESRRPYIFYNTWNYQERHRAWEHGKYLDTMNAGRMLDEIEIAHRMGVDVFVIDTGWYGKTGDWSVNRDFFPDGLDPIRRKLDSYGMKLGLWFSPRQAAVSSRIAREHLDCRSSRDGEPLPPQPVWETEESYSMCLVSRYWEAFADELIRCHREYGVTYYKWDAVGQYGCDDPDHFHGGTAHSPQERSELQAFEQVRYMQRIIDRLCAAVPEAIVDFDVTENRRSVGLAFLASGKYFLINNGPYYRSFDDPQYAPGGGMGSNVFVFPGAARARLCRSVLGFDRWIPSVLLLTHYLPDDPASSQLVNLASLMLGQNGIWGDLPAVSENGVRLFHETLTAYKSVREDITAAQARITGGYGTSPEIYEKVRRETGRGIVSLFASAPGTYRYVTRAITASTWHASPNAEVEILNDGRARIAVTLGPEHAGFVLFGTTEG